MKLKIAAAITLLAAMVLFWWALPKTDNSLPKTQICILTAFGEENLKSAMYSHLDGIQVSLLDKYGVVNNGARFIHPGWVESHHQYNVSSLAEIAEILEAYEPHSINAIFFGTHGFPGRASMHDKKNILDDLESIDIIKSRLARDGWFVLTGCLVALDLEKLSDFAKKINHPVVAATSYTGNNTNISMRTEGVWLLFFP